MPSKNAMIWFRTSDVMASSKPKNNVIMAGIRPNNVKR